MIEWLIQLLVLGFVIVLSGIRTLRFLPNELTDFELQRQVKKGVDAAILEQRLRQDRSLLIAAQRFVSLLLVIIIISLLASVYNILLTIVFALLWLVAAELLEARNAVQKQAEVLGHRYLAQLFIGVEKMRKPLSYIASTQVFRQERRTRFYSKDELLTAIREDKTVLTSDEKTLITQSLAYEHTMIKEVMTPRSVVVTIKQNETIGPILLDRLHKSGQSRFPVIEKDFDHVVGMLYMHNLVPLKPKIKKVADAMDKQVFYVHQDKTLEHALEAFLKTKHHLFIVVNDFEETTGVISIEDVLETILGREIVDEFDKYEDLRLVAKLAATKLQRSGSHI
jgi:CBS domain containing-hemolysin-like protein